MKKTNFGALIAVLLCVSSVSAWAKPHPIVLLVEDRADGAPGEYVILEGEELFQTLDAATHVSEPASHPEADTATNTLTNDIAQKTVRSELNFWERFNITRGVQITPVLPFNSVGGRVGVTTLNEMLELGAQAEIFFVPKGNPGHGNGSLGLDLGMYLQIAPIPGNIGHRFYLRGVLYRAFALVGRPKLNMLSVGGGLGYRQPLKNDKFHLYIEAMLVRDKLYEYDDFAVLPRINLGVTF